MSHQSIKVGQLEIRMKAQAVDSGEDEVSRLGRPWPTKVTRQGVGHPSRGVRPGRALESCFVTDDTAFRGRNSRGGENAIDH